MRKQYHLDLDAVFKTIVIILSASIFSFIPISAQTHYASNVAIGAKAGADLSRVGFYPSIRQSMKPGALIGFTFRYIEENHFGLIAELNFIQRGWKEKFDDEIRDKYGFSYSRTLNCFELPVLAHIYFGRRGRFFFNAGPQIGLLISESISSNFNYKDLRSVEGFPTTNRQTAQLDMSAQNHFDYGISAGLGGEFNINHRNSVSLEARFYFGLGNLMSAKRADHFSASNSMTLSLSAGYWFRIK